MFVVPPRYDVVRNKVSDEGDEGDAAEQDDEPGPNRRLVVRVKCRGPKKHDKEAPKKTSQRRILFP